jgi:hypothetical protein
MFDYPVMLQYLFSFMRLLLLYLIHHPSGQDHKEDCAEAAVQ